MGLTQCALIFYLAKKHNYPRSEAMSLGQVWNKFRHAFFSLLTPVIIIGGIWSGVFTPTEAAGVTVLYALVLTIFYRAMSFKKFFKMLKATMIDCAAIMWIMASITAYGYVLTRTNIPSAMASAILSITSNPILVLLILIVFLLIAGCFMSAMECIMLFTPIFLPLLEATGINLVFFGVIMCVTLMIGQLTPPFGTSLFIISKISGRPISRIFIASLPFIATVLVVIGLCLVFQDLVLFLPSTAL
jgi:tripartite ATP-independent transporter DctM subunit